MEKKSIGIILQISLIVVFAFFALACDTYNGVATKKELDELQGKPVSYAIQKFGPQSYISDDGQGGKIYTWEDVQGSTTNSSTRTYDYGGYVPPTRTTNTTTNENYCQRHVYVNANNIIYYWRWKGNRCP